MQLALSHASEPPMKTIGLIGGMSWESSALYYRLINELVRDRLGGFHSAKCVMASVDFADIERLQVAGEWDEAGRLLALEAQGLQAAGVDLIVLCTNTMHKVVGVIEASVQIPVIHIADVAAEAVQAAGLSTVGLLGTAFTMEQAFYRDRLEARGLNVIVPEPEDRATVHRIIYDELVLGIVTQESRDAYVAVIARLTTRGAEGVILGCTEIELLVDSQPAEVPVFATTLLHAKAAVDTALA